MTDNPREKYVYTIITLIGFTGVYLQIPLLGMTYLMALTPLIIGWVYFIKWVEKGKIDD